MGTTTKGYTLFQVQIETKDTIYSFEISGPAEPTELAFRYVREVAEDPNPLWLGGFDRIGITEEPTFKLVRVTGELKL